MIEVWKDINEYQGKYQISNLGRVKSILALKARGIVKEKILRKRFSKGYEHVWLSKNSNGKGFKTHRLVAEHFLPNFQQHLQINHIDGNTKNNIVSNLECVSNRENISHYNLSRNTSSKYTGVDWNKARRLWRARIRVGNKRYSLGYYIKEEDAHQAYLTALKQYNIVNKYHE